MLGAQLMIILDATVVNIALPQIQGGLHFSATSLSWVMNGYTLTFGGLLLLGGRAGDILGRRRMFLAGIIIFTLASLAGGLAPNAGTLLAARAVQGVGGALASPAVLALVVSGFAELPRPGARRPDHRVGLLALGAVHQRADRYRRGRPGPDVRHRDPAPARPLRPARRRQLDRRRGRAGLRLHPGRVQRLG
jgi:MFS family permease